MLHLAAKSRHETEMHLLLKNEEKANEKENYGNKALHFVARYGHEAVVRILLKYCTKVNEKSMYGNPALQLATEYENETMVLVQLLKVNYHLNDLPLTSLLSPSFSSISLTHLPTSF